MTSIEAFNSFKEQAITIDKPHKAFKLTYNDAIYYAYLSSNYTDLYLLFTDCIFVFPPIVASKYEEAVQDNQYNVKARYTLLLNQSTDKQSQTISFLRKPIEKNDYVFIVCDLGYVYGEYPTGSYCVIQNQDGSETIANPISIHIGIPYHLFIQYWREISIGGSNNNSADGFDYPMRDERFRLPIFKIIRYPPQQESPELSKYTTSNMPPNIPPNMPKLSVLESLPKQSNPLLENAEELRRKHRLQLSSVPQVLSINQINPEKKKIKQSKQQIQPQPTDLLDTKNTTENTIDSDNSVNGASYDIEPFFKKP